MHNQIKDISTLYAGMMGRNEEIKKMAPGVI
ncbi:hypothetical protein ATK78_1645 [Pedobacter metabolipauper]|uniref:Uncharacterized protein n=1 Tax=Pedobacter metabolipauper TaxID=425513 RepID=A0A4R6SUR7_9SPHI|nr:hypothetical protein ATK78_1645 [Pedobacter metabolipauper]